MVRKTIMKQRELRLPELFKNLLAIDIDENTYIDLHNDYHCHKIDYISESQQLRILFKAFNNTPYQVELVFNEVSFSKISFSFEDINDMATIDNLYRGRFESEGLKELSEDGRSYYYIEFYTGFSFELFASQITVICN